MNATPPIPPEAPRTDRTPYLFVAPLVVYLLLFQGYPLLQELYLSFTSTSLLSPGKHKFVGLINYADLVNSKEDMIRFNDFLMWQGQADVKKMSREDQIAFYINAYNSSNIRTYSGRALRIHNVGKRGSLHPEYSTLWQAKWRPADDE